MSNFGITGLDSLKDLQKTFERAAQKSKDLDGTKVDFDELFTEEFMLEHANLSSFDAFLKQGNFEVNSEEDFVNIPDDVFDEYVSKYTDFPNWEEMLGTATEEYALKYLGLS